MGTKLTLSIEEKVIEDAKKYARENGRSLSSIVEEYFKSLVSLKTSSRQEKLNSIILELKGSVKMPDDFRSYKDSLEDALIEKHLK